MRVVRPVRLPTADFDRMWLPVLVQSPDPAWRFHALSQSALPFSRNPGHRSSPSGGPFSVLHLGEEVAKCLWERFGDDVLNPGAPVARSLWLSRAISGIEMPEFQLCDLMAETTRTRAWVDLSALKHPDVAVLLAWGSAVQRHPAQFDGLRYASRFDGGACLALFDRDGPANRLQVTQVDQLARLPSGEVFLKRHAVALLGPDISYLFCRDLLRGRLEIVSRQRAARCPSSRVRRCAIINQPYCSAFGGWGG